MGTFFSFILLLIILLILYTSLRAFLSLAPWVPTRSLDLERIARLSQLQPGETFYDLGCGNGRVVNYLSCHYPKNKIIGLELALPLYLLAKFRQLVSRRANLKIKFINFFNADLKSANAIYLFGLPKQISKKLPKKLLKELAPGSRIISYSFPIPGNWSEQIINKPQPNDITIYKYIV